MRTPKICIFCRMSSSNRDKLLEEITNDDDYLADYRIIELPMFNDYIGFLCILLKDDDEEFNIKCAENEIVLIASLNDNYYEEISFSNLSLAESAMWKFVSKFKTSFDTCNVGFIASYW